MRPFLWIIVLGFLVAACSSSEHLDTAQAETHRFWQMMEAEQFASIYADAAEDFRKATSEEGLAKFLSAVNRKLGKMKTAKKESWNVNYHTSGTFVTLGYNTQLDQGKATEQFVFVINDRKASLVRYNINSAELVTN